MKITITVNVERKNKAPKTETEPGPDIRVGTGGMQNANAGYTAKSWRTPRTLGFVPTSGNPGQGDNAGKYEE